MKIVLFFLCFTATLLNAQSPTKDDRSFLTIMVVPYTNMDQNVRKVLEENDMYRTVIGKIDQIFEERGYRNKNYLALLNLLSLTPSVANLERSDIIEAIKNAKVDVVIYAEIEWRTYSEGDSQLALKLRAIDQYSAESYATNVSVTSNRRYYQVLTQALNDNQLADELKGFADQLDRKFDDILVNGRTVTIKVIVNPGSKFTMDSVPDGTTMDLGGSIDQWVKKRAARMYSANSNDTYWEGECKLRLMDAEGNMVTPYSFRSDLKRFLSQLSFSKIPVKTTTGATINSVIEIILDGR